MTSARDAIQTGEDLRHAREALGLSVYALAEELRMGMHGPDRLRKTETGSRELSGPIAVAVGYMLEKAGLLDG